MLKSLYAQILLWLLAPLLVIVAVDAAATYRSAQTTARLVQERQLLGSARTIAEQVSYADGKLTVSVPPAALELFDAGYGDYVHYRVTAASGELLAGRDDLSLPANKIEPERWSTFDTEVNGEPTYAVAFAQPVFAPGSLGPVIVVVAQTLRERSVIARNLWLRGMRDQILLIALGTLLIWAGVQRGITPLRALRTRMQQRAPAALEPLTLERVPSELKPMVEAMNDYIAQLREQMQAHTRFIADASHQLRTPLAVMNTQLDVALRETDDAAKDHALAAIKSSLRSNIRVVNQLLSYTEAEGSNPRVLRSNEPVDLAEIVRDVVVESVTQAHAKDIDLGVDLQCDSLPVVVAAHALHVLVANLVDNALRYTQAGGKVTVRLSHDGATSVLEVVDNGPGIAPDQRERVFERFTRLHGKEIDGCGLGLAIVREIADAGGASVMLGSPPAGQGLIVRVTFS